MTDLWTYRAFEHETEADRFDLRHLRGGLPQVDHGAAHRGACLVDPRPQARVAAVNVAELGPSLRGVGLVPPLAGRSPSYILRQLVGFHTGARATPASAPMQEVAAKLSIDDMVAAAAYAGSRRP